MPVSPRRPHTRAGSMQLAATALLSALAAAGLLAPSAVSAQSPVSPGTLSISLGLQEAPQAGLWLTATNHTRLGLLGTMERTTDKVDGPGSLGDSDTRMRYTVGPALKWYILSSTAGVSPYWLAAASVGVDDRPDDTRTTFYTASGGFGADWFPTPLVSFGGFTGVDFSYDRTRAGDFTTTRSSLGTLTAGLEMHVYF